MRRRRRRRRRMHACMPLLHIVIVMD